MTVIQYLIDLASSVLDALMAHFSDTRRSHRCVEAERTVLYRAIAAMVEMGSLQEGVDCSE